MNKTITLYNRMTSIDELPENLQKHIEWLQAIMEKIPVEFRDSGTIEMSAGDYRLEYEVNYIRPETIDEVEARAKAEAMSAEKARSLELDMLAKLKAKYPNYE